MSIADISPKLLSGHSFCIGAITTASRQNVSDNMIKPGGRWSSQAYQPYIRTDLQDL